MEEDRESVIAEIKAECDLMKKLRNPYIISYIGSVTYIPQISVVMQYAMFDSLVHYCRPPPNGVRLLYLFKMVLCTSFAELFTIDVFKDS